MTDEEILEDLENRNGIHRLVAQWVVNMDRHFKQEQNQQGLQERDEP
jgi:hypothetical protein